MLRQLLLTFTLTGSIAATASADCILQADASFQKREDLSHMLFEPQLVAADPTQFSWNHAEAFPDQRIDSALSPDLDCAGKGQGQGQGQGQDRAAAGLEEESRDFRVRFVAMPDYAPVEWKDVSAPGASDGPAGLAGMVPAELGPAPAMVKGNIDVKSIATGRTLAQPQHSADIRVTIPEPEGTPEAPAPARR